MSTQSVDLSQFAEPKKDEPIDLTQYVDLAQYATGTPTLPPEGPLSSADQWAKRLVALKDKFMSVGTPEEIPTRERVGSAFGTAFDAMELATTPAGNIAQELVKRTNPKEILKPVDLHALTSPESEDQPMAGHKAQGFIKLAAGMAPMVPPVWKAGKMVNSLMKAGRAAREANVIEQAAREAAPFMAKGTALEIPEVASETISGTKAALDARAQLGRQANLIPGRLFEPTEPQVRAAREIGPQAGLIPDSSLAELPSQIAETRRIREALNKSEFNITTIQGQLEATRKAALKDPRTEAKLRAALAEEKRTLKDLRYQMKELGPEKVTGPLEGPQDVKLNVPPQKEGLFSRGKQAVTKLSRQFQDTNRLLEVKGYKQIPDRMNDAIYKGDVLENRYMEEMANIFAKYGLHVKGRGEAVARILNGEKSNDEVLNVAAQEIRRRLLDPAHAEVANDPAVRGLIGPVGYLKDYFPHMQERLLKATEDPELVRDMIHDLLPKNLKAAYFKERKIDTNAFNVDLKDVLESYIRGVRKTKYDLLAYRDGLQLANQIPDAGLKTEAMDMLRNFIGQPSARMHEGMNEAKRWVSKQYYRSFIGGNPFSAGINVTQSWFNTVPAAGFKNVGKGLWEMARNPKAATAEARRAGVLEGYPQLEEMALKFKSDPKSVMERIDRVLFAPFQKAEKFNRVLAYQAGKAKAVGEGVEDVTRAGWDMARKTQFLYGRKAPVPYARDNILIGQFSNYPLKQRAFFVDMVKDPKKWGPLAVVYGLPAAAAEVLMSETTEEGRSSGLMNLVDSFVGDALPAPGIGPFGKDMSDLGTYVYRVRNGQVKQTPQQIIETIVKYIPGYRSAVRVEKMMGGKHKPLFGAFGEGQ